MSEEQRTTHPVEPGKVKVGDLMAFTYYGFVTSAARGGEYLNIRGVAGTPEQFSVNGDELVKASASADQYHEEVRVTMTKAAELLVASVNRPFTVCFVKQDKTERVLKGRLVQPEPLLGRSHVEDLEVAGDNKLRLVDHRTVKWLVVDGVKYVVGKG